MDIVLFLGSGVSRPSGVKGVEEVTREVLEGDYHLGSDGRSFVPKEVESDFEGYDPTADIQGYLQLLEGYLNVHLEKQHPGSGIRANYEQIHHLNRQVNRTVNGLFDEVVVSDFAKKVESKMSPLFNKYSTSNSVKIYYASARASDYIDSVVYDSLSKPINIIRGFDLLKQMVTSGTVKRLRIVTLNHDLLVERVLRDLGIPYTDGFRDPDGDVRWFDPQHFWQRGPRVGNAPEVTLIKLHGSLDWFVFGDEHTYAYGIPLNGSPINVRDSKGDLVPNNGTLPSIITGGNKELRYLSWIYSDLLEVFLHTLRSSERIIMSGFSWNDIGVSMRLMEWMHRGAYNRILLLHENPDQLRTSSCFGPDPFNGFHLKGKLEYIPKWFSDTTLDEVLSLC